MFYLFLKVHCVLCPSKKGTGCIYLLKRHKGTRMCTLKKKTKTKDAYSHASPKALESGSKVPQTGLPRLDSQAKRDTPEKVQRNKGLKRGVT